MITREKLLDLLKSTETYRVEKTISTTNMDKFCEAICAFANDMPNSKKKGMLEQNGNGPANFVIDRITTFGVNIKDAC